MYGFNESEKTFGVEFKIFVNDNRIIPRDFDFNIIKNNDIIKIYYNDSGCFELFFHLIVYEVDNYHDNDYYFRKELEK